MIHLYLALTVITLLACLAVIYPWLKKQQSLYADKNRIKILYSDKLTELDNDLEQEKLSPSEYASLKQELTEQLAYELSYDSQLNQKIVSRKWIWLLPPVTLVVSFIIYHWQQKPEQMQQWFNAQQTVSEVGKKIVSGQSPANREELEAFYLGLRGQLSQSPEDSTGWFLLGRIAYSLGYLDEAIAAFEKSRQLKPDNYATNMSYAQALITRGEESHLRRAAQVYASILQTNNQDAEALTMSGFIAMQLDEVQMAQNFWQRALKYLPNDDDRRSAIVQTLNEMQQKTAAVNEQEEPTTQAQQGQLQINLSLSRETQQQLADFNYLWLFARSGNAGPPAAVKRISLAQIEFPMTVSLSDADAMMPSLKLSLLEQVVVTARLTQTEDVMQAEQMQKEIKSDLIDLAQSKDIKLEL
ncbi:c-type cytochrome biogenesis protein CcmI [Gayadomonas joobiniege]|uniref:c-type cytochrome biogenesis protein CcmI n=1 Tax=Gayadomonas joobiniege TaxID=1234606 RepID=UPI00035FBEA0|nr:c-type cytochrome biogenesis protein CcmI [Gayadomonas joobiniege]